MVNVKVFKTLFTIENSIEKVKIHSMQQNKIPEFFEKYNFCQLQKLLLTMKDLLCQLLNCLNVVYQFKNLLNAKYIQITILYINFLSSYWSHYKINLKGLIQY